MKRYLALVLAERFWMDSKARVSTEERAGLNGRPDDGRKGESAKNVVSAVFFGSYEPARNTASQQKRPQKQPKRFSCVPRGH